MKKIQLSIFIFLLIFLNAFAQIDTTSLSYYPLNDGDYWEYLQEIENYWYPYGTKRAYYSHIVVGDTTFLVGKTFKIIKRTALDSTQSTSYIYERIDSLTCNVYRYDTYRGIEFLIDSLKSQPGDTSSSDRGEYYFDFTGRTACLAINPDTVFSHTTQSKEFYQFESLFPLEYKLSQKFGLTEYTFYFDFGRWSEFLLYARIDSIEYGTQVNSIPKNNPQLLTDFQLYQNYPNPFNPTTNIRFLLPKSENIALKVYNLKGQEVETLVAGKIEAGYHLYTWDASEFASGVYIIVLQGKNKSQIKKCLLIK